jgi:arylsulfatase A-like enzyme
MAGAKKPNIVFILADDLGIGDLKCYGGDRCQVDTPYADSLAAQGMRFTDAHSVSSVCMPVRISIMTGRYPWRFQHPLPSGPWGFCSQQIPTDHFTTAKMLRDAGYRTGYVGKWHLGTQMQTTDEKVQGPENVDFTKPLKMGPPQMGFDYSFILPGSLDMYPYVFVRNNEFVGKVTQQRGWSAFNRVGPAAEGFEDYKVLDTFSTEAEQFVERQAESAKAGNPFFLYFALTAPHTPTCPSPKFQGKSKLGIYGDFLMETDDCVGRVLNALKAHGLDDNTLVILTADNGPALYAGNIREATVDNLRQLEKAGHYSRGIYRDYKFSAYEGGLRMPYLVRWPGVVKPGSVCNRLIGLNDLMATLADVTQTRLPENAAPDSVSFLPLLRNAEAEAPRKEMLLQSSMAFFVVRQGNWKLILTPGSGGKGMYGQSSDEEGWRKAIETFGRIPLGDELRAPPFIQLYNMADDPQEAQNVAASHPERVERMLAVLDRQIAGGRSTPGPKLKNDTNIVVHPRLPAFMKPNKAK